jgi:hypothetical protein
VEGADEAVEVGVAVGVGDQRHQSAVVGELDVDAAVLLKPVGGREAGDTQPNDVESQVGWVEREGARALCDFRAHEIEGGHVLDRAAQSVSSRDRVAEELLTVALELASCRVDRGEQQEGGARRLLKLEDQLESSGVDQVTLDTDPDSIAEGGSWLQKL